jgi:hypothetical protein
MTSIDSPLGLPHHTCCGPGWKASTLMPPHCRPTARRWPSGEKQQEAAAMPRDTTCRTCRQGAPPDDVGLGGLYGFIFSIRLFIQIPTAWVLTFRLSAFQTNSLPLALRVA